MQIKHYQAQGVTLAYYEAGKGKTILFIPGAGVSVLLYREILTMLAKEHRVIAVDLPGFGRSSVPSRVWQLSDYASYLGGFMKTKNVGEYWVIGHSVGGGIALLMSGTQETINRVIAIDFVNVGTEKDLGKRRRGYLFGKNYNSWRIYHDLPRLLRLGWSFCMSTGRHLIHLKKLVQIVRQSVVLGVEGNKLSGHKTVLIYGKEDELLTENEQHKMEQVIKPMETRLVAGNHDWLLFSPELFMETVKPYLN